MRAKICPISGPGYLSKSERERRAREIIAESGADTVEHFNQVVKQSHGVTFREQANWWLNHIRRRKRKPLAPATLELWKGCLDNWINPNIGDLPLCEVNNSVLKTLVAKMSEGGLSPKTISDNYVPVVRMVVASAVDEQGEEIYPRKWNNEFIDLPVVEKDKQNILWESNAIAGYLASGSSLLPTTARERADVERWGDWQLAHFGPAVGKVAFQRLVKPMTGQGQPDPKVVEEGTADYAKFTRVLEASLGNKEYVAGRLSIADFILGAIFSIGATVGLETAPFPKVNAWLGRVMARDSMRRALADAQSAMPR